MTEAELEAFRLKMQVQVLRVLVEGLYTGLANSSPDAAQVLRDQFARLRQEHSRIVLPNLPEGYSDMLAAEYQDALEETLRFIEDGIR